MDKAIIVAAITGAITQKSKNSNLPTTVSEIIECAYQCYLSGAAVIHIHVRDKDGNPSLCYETYEKVINGIRQKCDVLICISTSSFGVKIDDNSRLQLLDLHTDFASLTFGNVIRKNGVNNNSDYYIQSAYRKMLAKKIIPEIEIFNKDMLLRCIQIFKDKPISPYIQLIFGVDETMNADYGIFSELTNLIPKHWLWSAAAVGKNQLPVNLMCLLKGGRIIRTGFEDNIYLYRGKLAESNQQLVSRLRNYMLNLNIECASPQEAKRIFENYNFQH